MATAFDTCIEAMSLKTKYTASNFNHGKIKYEPRCKKISDLKQKVKPKQTANTSFSK